MITEYGVADLRGRSDADVIAAMLSIADSRFQDELMRQAKDAGKLAKAYQIPSAHRENYPDRITKALKPARDAGLLPAFPFGSDFTDVEQRLIPALQILAEASANPLDVIRLAAKGFFAGQPDSNTMDCLSRLHLDRPKSLSDRLYRALVIGCT